MHRFRAVAIDYDGTLTTDLRPRDDVLDAIREYRDTGGTVVLCTGRILSELRSVFPEYDRHFDAAVGENGAVCWCPGAGERPLAPPVDEALERALRAGGVPLRRGSVLLATQGAATELASAEIARLGVDAQLIHNRSELMLLPSGVTKGTGLVEVLAELGISRHSTAGIGDAENDHGLFDACEVGIAVANAVESLKRRADVVLGEADGSGVIEFLRGAVARGEILVHPDRWRLEIGTTCDGEAVRLPGSDIDLLIAGSTGSGKSHLAGLVIEQAVSLGYTVCVVDPEGDHRDLARLRGVLTIGGTDGTPEPADVVRLLRNRFTSVVIDLSLLDGREQVAYWGRLGEALQALRVETGTPHWIVLEEADRLLGDRMLRDPAVPHAPSGFCLVTYHPEALSAAVLAEIDCVLALRGAECFARIPVLDAAGAPPRHDAERMFTLESGMALLADREGLRRFRPAPRRTRHVRHWHKYLTGQVAPRLRFHFRDRNGPTGRSAGNISELHRELRRATSGVLLHHLQNGDVSRWLLDVIRDDSVAEDVRGLERWIQAESRPDSEVARRALLRTIERRYQDEASFAADGTPPATAAR